MANGQKIDDCFPRRFNHHIKTLGDGIRGVSASIITKPPRSRPVLASPRYRKFGFGKGGQDVSCMTTESYLDQSLFYGDHVVVRMDYHTLICKLHASCFIDLRFELATCTVSSIHLSSPSVNNVGDILSRNAWPPSLVVKSCNTRRVPFTRWNSFHGHPDQCPSLHHLSISSSAV